MITDEVDEGVEEDGHENQEVKEEQYAMAEVS